MSRRLQLYLCHADVDKPAVRELYRRLENAGFKAWFDEEDLVYGSDRVLAITAAIKEADVILICLSQPALANEGYIHKEMRLALDKAEEQPEGAITIIPLRLDNCGLPYRLQNLVPLDLSGDNGYEKLLKTLRKLAEKRGLDTSPAATGPAEQRQEQSNPGNRPQGSRRVDTGGGMYNEGGNINNAGGINIFGGQTGPVNIYYYDYPQSGPARPEAAANPRPAPESQPSGSEDKAAIRRYLNDRFSLSELRDLATDLNIDHESLPHAGKGEFARELLLHCERVGNLPDLLTEALKSRPDEPVRQALERINRAR